jgi:hypothetical protein
LRGRIFYITFLCTCLVFLLCSCGKTATPQATTTLSPTPIPTSTIPPTVSVAEVSSDINSLAGAFFNLLKAKRYSDACKLTSSGCTTETNAYMQNLIDVEGVPDFYMFGDSGPVPVRPEDFYVNGLVTFKDGSKGEFQFEMRKKGEYWQITEYGLINEKNVQSPESIASFFLNFLKDERYADAYELLSESIREEVDSLEAFRGFFSKDRIPDTWSLKNKQTNETDSGTYIGHVYEFSMKNGREGLLSIVFMQSGMFWNIEGFNYQLLVSEEQATTIAEAFLGALKIGAYPQAFEWLYSDVQEEFGDNTNFQEAVEANIVMPESWKLTEYVYTLNDEENVARLKYDVTFQNGSTGKAEFTIAEPEYDEVKIIAFNLSR